MLCAKIRVGSDPGPYSSPASHRKPKMCVEASIEVNNSAPSSPFEAIFGPEGRSLILGPEGHRTSSFGRTKNVRAEVSSTQFSQLQVRKIRPLSFLEFGFPLSNFVHEFFLEPGFHFFSSELGSTFSRAHKNSRSVRSRSVGGEKKKTKKKQIKQSQILIAHPQPVFSKLLFVIIHKIESIFTIFCSRLLQLPSVALPSFLYQKKLAKANFPVLRSLIKPDRNMPIQIPCAEVSSVTTDDVLKDASGLRAMKCRGTLSDCVPLHCVCHPLGSSEPANNVQWCHQPFAAVGQTGHLARPGHSVCSQSLEPGLSKYAMLLVSEEPPFILRDHPLRDHPSRSLACPFSCAQPLPARTRRRRSAGLRQFNPNGA